MEQLTTSKYVTVHGYKMHYLEVGAANAPPILFVHGMPTSSYLWRNIMPAIAEATQTRCIALDLIGMGKSAKPDIEYRLFDHIQYFDGFVDALGLQHISLVLHGWGSVIGFDHASRHEQNIRALAFFESHIRPTVDWDMLSLPVQQFASLLHHPEASYKAIVEQNYMIDKLLPSGVVRELSAEELSSYREPFKTVESRKLLWQYVQDLPLGNGSDDVLELISKYSDWLQQTNIPKLMLYAVPGFITTIDTVQWALDNLPNLGIEELDDAMHFAQESAPELFGKHLKQWYLQLSQRVLT